MALSGSEQVFNIPKTLPSRETYPPKDGRSVSTLIRPESGPALKVGMPRLRSVAGAAAGVGIAGGLHKYEGLGGCLMTLDL